MPKIGDRVKCKRCKAVWEFNLCGNCDTPHPFRSDEPGIADGQWECCPECGTREEVIFLRRQGALRKAQQAANVGGQGIPGA